MQDCAKSELDFRGYPLTCCNNDFDSTWTWLLPLGLSCFLLLLLSMFLQLVKTTLLFLFLLTLVLQQCTRKPFSFEMAWLSDPSCEALIVEVWTSVSVMGSPLYRVCERL